MQLLMVKGKVFVPLLRRLTLNDHIIKDIAEFANDIIQQNSSLFMASLDNGSLLANIPSEYLYRFTIKGGQLSFHV